MVKFTRPATTLLAPGAAIIWPTVHTRPSASASAEHSKPQPRSCAGGTCPRRTFAPLLHEHHGFCRSCKRVAAQVHGDRASVALLAGHAHCEPRLACDGRHNANRQTQTFKHRALLDVHLDVCAHAAGGCGLTAHIGIQRAKVSPGPKRLRTSGMSIVSCGKQHVLRRAPPQA